MRFTTLLATLLAATAAAAPARAKWPPWLSIETPVNPFDGSATGAVFLVHAAMREGSPTLADVSGSAEGLVAGTRRSIALELDATSRPGVFAVRRQWPSEGTWIVRVSLATTTAIVTLDREGNVAGVRIPTTLAEGRPIPRAVVARDIDSTLTVASSH
jgi:hypothetical protein